MILSAEIGSGSRDEALDGWRGVACLLVYFAHKAISVEWPPLVVLGLTGVHMFFVLSGYLLSGPFLAAMVEARPWPSTWRYYLRRFLRIYPPYVVSLGLYLAARLALGDKLPDPTNLVTHLLLAFNYAKGTYYYSINAVYWSLAIEAQYYLLLPIVARIFGSRPATLVIVMTVVGLASRAFEVLAIGPRPGASDVQYTSIFAHLDWFAAGMAVALADIRGAPKKGGLAWIGLGVLVYLAGTNLRYSWHGPLADRVVTIGFPSVICSGLGMILWGIRIGPARPLRLKPLVWVGTISYSLFLYHIGVQVALQRTWPMRSIADPGANNLAQAIVALPPTLALSALMFLVVERPCLRAMARAR